MSTAPSLLERIAAGDDTAVRECLDRYRGLIWSLARRYAESAADAEDAVQEVFLEVWKSAARFDARAGSESLFITTIARRRLIDRLRARRRRPETEEFDESLHDLAAFEGDHEAPLRVEIDAASRAIAALDPKTREVLLLGIVEELTHSEIATRTGRPLGTVKTQMRRGMQRVRELLGTVTDDEGTDLR